MSTPEIPFNESGFEDVTPPTDGRSDQFSPDNPPWSVPAAFGFWIMSLLFMVVTQTVFVIGYVLYRGIKLAAVAEVLTKDPEAIFVEILSIIPAHLLTVGLAWLLVTSGGKRPFLRTLGWEWGRGFTFWRSTGLAVGMLLVGSVIIWLAGNPATELDMIIASSRMTALATAFLATFTAPFVEEVTYRGVFYSALQRAAGKVFAVIFVGLLFTLIHVLQYRQNYGVIATILILSFTLTLIRARTGRLLPCVVVHTVFNGIQSLIIVLNPYLERVSPQTTPTEPGALLHVLVQLFIPHVRLF